MSDALDRASRELNSSFDANVTLPKMRERIAAAFAAGIDPDDASLRRAVRAGMNAECPPGQGITDRGAELALIALRNVFQKASS